MRWAGDRLAARHRQIPRQKVKRWLDKAYNQVGFSRPAETELVRQMATLRHLALLSVLVVGAGVDRLREEGSVADILEAVQEHPKASPIDGNLVDLLLADDVRTLLAHLGTVLRTFVAKYVTDAELQRSAIFSGSSGTRARRVRFTTKRGQFAPRTAGRPSSVLGTTPKSHIVPAPPLAPTAAAPPKRSALAQGVARGVKRLRLSSFGE